MGYEQVIMPQRNAEKLNKQLLAKSGCKAVGVKNLIDAIAAFGGR